MPIPVDKCIVCDSTDSYTDKAAALFLNLSDPFTVSRCKDCGMRWLNPQPTTSEYERIYSKAYFTKDQHIDNDADALFAHYPPRDLNYEAIEVPKRTAGYIARLQRIKHFNNFNGKQILDIGAASGDFLAHARNDGWNVTGIELSRYACDRAKEKHDIDLQCTDLTRFSSDIAFDVIHLSHVFEHLIDPVEALTRIRRLMHEHSLLVIEVPSQFESWNSIIFRKVLHKQMERNLFSIHHPFFYGPKQLCYLLEKHGFKILNAQSYFPERYNFGWRSKVYRVIDYVGDLAGGFGTDIEVISTPKNAGKK